MTDITASQVKQLREKTGAGMMDCKKALGECDGDMESAVDWLRKKGLSAAAKKSGRVATEGLIGVIARGTEGAMVEINAETDFVARNDRFQEFTTAAAEAALAAGGDTEKILQSPWPGGTQSFAEQLTANIATIGENMNLRRARTLSVPRGAVAAYVHSALRPGLGKIGVLVALASDGDAEKLSAFGKQLAMHVAAARPEFLDIDAVDPAALAREKEIFAEQARAAGKPENIIGKMVEGRVRKYYEQAVLNEQVFVIDGETKVADALKRAEGDVGAGISIAGFACFVLGEGIARKEQDFAAEVAAAIDP